MDTERQIARLLLEFASDNGRIDISALSACDIEAASSRIVQRGRGPLVLAALQGRGDVSTIAEMFTAMDPYAAAAEAEYAERQAKQTHPGFTRPVYSPIIGGFTCGTCGQDNRGHINGVYCPEWALRETFGR